MTTVLPMMTGNSRIFLIEGRARGDHQPKYQSCVRAGAPERGYGDSARVEVPDPAQYGKFQRIARVRGAADDPTIGLQGRYLLDKASELLRLAEKGCAIDIQVHMGSCTDPSLFNKFSKAIVLEDAIITKWGTDDMGALQSDENAVVNESADMSASGIYEILPMAFSIKAEADITNEIVALTICDSIQCGECGTESGGCDVILAVSKAEGGSPGTPADVLYSVDGGVTWNVSDVDALSASDNPTGIACIGDYVVVISVGAEALYYVDKSELLGTGDETWVEEDLGFVAGKGANAIISLGNVAFMAANGGYIYKMGYPTDGVEVVEAGSGTVDNLLAIDALDEMFVVAVGNNGAILRATDGQNFESMTRFTPLLTNFTTVQIVDENIWWVGTSTGKLYYTNNGGSDWYEKPFSGSGSGVVESLSFATRSVGFMSHTTAAGRARIMRTYDGGYSWSITPERSGASLPLGDRIKALATCAYDVNFVVGAGLADNGTDGYLVVGTD